MDVRTLKYFLTVASEGNITKAAEVLHITQPTLSRQLIELEKELNTSLLIRGKRNITLTGTGVLLQQRAQEIIALLDKTEQDITEQGRIVKGIVSIGCVETSASLLLPDTLKEFAARYPMVRYDIYSGNGDDIRDKIDSGHLDMGILIEPIEVAKYDSAHLPFVERVGVLMRADDPLADGESIRLDEITRLPVIISRRRILINELESWFGESEEDIRILAYHNLLTNSLLLVEHGLAYCITGEGAYSIRPIPNVRFIPLDPERKFGHVLAWKKNRMFGSAASFFLEFVRDKYQA